MINFKIMALSIELADLVLTSMLNGNSLTKSLKDHDVTSYSFFEELKANTYLSNKYNHARQVRAELLVDEIIEIADTDEDAQRARNRIDVRRWYASKMQPQTYGDRIDLNVTNSVDINAALMDARQRVIDISPATVAHVNPLTHAKQSLISTVSPSTESVESDEVNIFD